MLNATVRQLLQDVETLPSAERQQLIKMLRRRQTHNADDELASALLKKGIVLTVPPQRTATQIARFKAWQPIEMPGDSLSDELVRDRR